MARRVTIGWKRPNGRGMALDSLIMHLEESRLPVLTSTVTEFVNPGGKLVANKAVLVVYVDGKEAEDKLDSIKLEFL